MFFDNAGVKLYYEKSGSGAPLLLLHGWGGRADSFLPVTRDFSQARTVYAVDFPGHGNSPEPPQPWSVTAMAGIPQLLARFTISFTSDTPSMSLILV